MKKTYQMLQLHVIALSVADVITASNDEALIKDRVWSINPSNASGFMD